MQRGSGALALLPDAILFELVAVFCVLEVCSAARLLQRLKGGSYGMIDDPELGSGSSPGAEMRRWLQLVLAVACFARGIVLVCDMAVYNPPAAYRTVPDMLFLTAYSLLALFWAQLHFTATGVGSRALRPVFLSGLGLLYAAFLVIVVLLLSAGRNDDATSDLRSAMFYLVGVAYLVVFGFATYFGARVSTAARRGPRAVFCKTVGLAVVCNVVLLVRSVFYLAIAAMWLRLHDLFPVVRDRYRFDACVFALLELLPSAAMYGLTRRKRHGNSSPGSSEAGIGNMYSRGAAGSFSTSPIMNNGRHQLMYGSNGSGINEAPSFRASGSGGFDSAALLNPTGHA